MRMMDPEGLREAMKLAQRWKRGMLIVGTIEETHGEEDPQPKAHSNLPYHMGHENHPNLTTIRLNPPPLKITQIHMG